MYIWFFNPENDLCLANGDPNFVPPASARRLAQDLLLLPLSWAAPEDLLLTENEQSPEFPLHARFMPWGWSEQVVKRLLRMGAPSALLPTSAELEKIRFLSHRRTGIDFLQALSAPEDSPFREIRLPQELFSSEDVVSHLRQYPDTLLKTPWSSSGKGLYWTNSGTSDNLLRWLQMPLKKMGSVLAEPILDKVCDFAMGFEILSPTQIRFLGYSLFETDEKGSYRGNLLRSNEQIREQLRMFIPLTQLEWLEERIPRVLASLVGTDYRGIVGIDMMVHRAGDRLHLHPCVEINLRMTMGMAARLFYDRHVEPGAVGNFYIHHDPSPAELARLHTVLAQTHPPVYREDRLVRGFLPLTPRHADSTYSAYVILE